jgi:hypothetical protein
MRNRYGLCSICGAAAMLFVLGATTPASATSAGVAIVPPGRTLFGMSYNELVNEWTNWVLKEPVATNPALDNDGRDCARNQRGKVWFLAATFAGQFGEDAIANRDCTVPAGKAIFFAIDTFVSFAPEFLKTPPCDAIAKVIGQIRCDVNDDVRIAPKVRLTLEVDGKPVGDLFAYRVQSPPGGYALEITPGSPFNAGFGLDPGVRKPAVSDGYYYFLRPLPRGTHTIKFSADFDSDGAPDQGANYTLTVQ